MEIAKENPEKVISIIEKNEEAQKSENIEDPLVTGDTSAASDSDDTTTTDTDETTTEDTDETTTDTVLDIIKNKLENEEAITTDDFDKVFDKNVSPN